VADNRRLAQPSSTRPLVNEDGSPSTQFNTWLKIITDQSMIIGTGSPEGVVSAIQTSFYMDESGVTEAVLYIKRDADDGLGDTTKGWILV
jgi:hypothetical protein